MSQEYKPKLTIHIGEIQVESDPASTDLSNHVLRGFLAGLKNMRDDLNNQGIETTITVQDAPLDEYKSEV